MAQNPEYRLICEAVKPGSRVLDLGCGRGDLLGILAAEKQVRGLGIDIDLESVIEVIDRGHDILQGDIDKGLSVFSDQSFDYAILGSTVQQVRHPRRVLCEMVRVAREGIVTFPNFGHWLNRLGLLFRGRMPKSRVLPFEWFETPNIHLATRNDFFALCRSEGITIVDAVCLPAKPIDRLLIGMKRCNIGAERVFLRITRDAGAEEVSNCRRC